MLINESATTKPMYRADIDGLRAIAILSVVAFHAAPEYIKGGFIGVDIFFVISGFLISTIIFSNLQRDHFSFVEFYKRRINRIFPALLLVLTTCFAFGWFALMPGEYKQLGKHIAGGAGFISNFVLLHESGYFDNTIDTKPLLHLWTLGIEEQYYIVWPLILWVAWKRKLNLLHIALIIAVISFALNIGKVHRHAVAVFYSPQTRFWELLVGSILAYIMLYPQTMFSKLSSRFGRWLRHVYPLVSEKNNKILSNIKSVLGAGLIIFTIAIITKEKLFPGWWAVLPTIGAALLISAGTEAWLNRRILSHPIMIWFGLISYPLYLWHWPLLSYARIIEGETPSRTIRCIAVIIAVVLAWLTYKLVEKPFRFGNHNKVKTIALPVLRLIIGSVGYNCYKQDGFEFRSNIRELQITYALKWNEIDKVGTSSDERCTKQHPYPGLGYCLKTNYQKEVDVALVGDSHAFQYFPGLSNVFERRNSNLLLLGVPGCLPFYNVDSAEIGSISLCKKAINASLDYIVNNKNIKTVVLASRGPLYLTGHGFGNVDPNNRYLKLTNSPKNTNSTEIFYTAMEDTLEKLTKSGKKVYFIIDIPELGFDPRQCINFRPFRFSKKNKTLCAVEKKKYMARNQDYLNLVDKIITRFPGVKTLNPSNFLCDTTYCYAIQKGLILYRDNNHPSFDGSIYIGNMLEKELV